MTLTVMKKSFKKLVSKIVTCRSYKHFLNKVLRGSLLNEVRKEVFVSNHNGFKKFCNISSKILIQHAPLKTKYTRSNQMSFITKDLSKEIIKISRLRNNFLKSKTHENRLLNTNKEITVHSC